MNRQALAFLTMFSLILMLSVYYVTIPDDAVSVSTTSQNAKQFTTSLKKDSTQLQADATKKKQALINEQSNTIADEHASNTQKQEAIESMSKTKEALQMETTIKKALQDKGMESVVELEKDTCVITIFNCEDQHENVSAVLKTVYDLIGQQYFVEVSFKKK